MSDPLQIDIASITTKQIDVIEHFNNLAAAPKDDLDCIFIDGADKSSLDAVRAVTLRRKRHSASIDNVHTGLHWQCGAAVKASLFFGIL